MYEEIRVQKNADRYELAFARELAAVWVVVIPCAAGRALCDTQEELISAEVENQWPGGRVDFEREAKTAIAINPAGFSLDLLTGEVK